MKKKLWMLGMAIIALTSCTEKEVIDIPEGKPIGFEAMINKTTRAADSNTSTDVTTANIPAFYVFGNVAKYNPNDDYPASTSETQTFRSLFNNVLVQKTGGKWSYANETVKQQYWQLDSLYRFAAYANGLYSTENAAMLTSTNTPSVTYHPEDDKTTTGQGQTAVTVNNGDYLEFTDYEAGPHDLIASIYGDKATNTGLPTSGFKIQFPFKHMLTKVVLDFGLASDLPNSDLIISNVKINNAHKVATGKMYYHEGAKDIVWELPTNNSTPGGYSEESPFKLAVATESHPGDFVVFYVIPHGSTQDITLSFDATNYLKGTWGQANATITTSTHSHTYDLCVNEVAESASWKPGLMYRYVLRFGALNDSEPIIFGDPIVDPWQSATQSGGIVLLQGTAGHNE